jgi:hypothetical protein
VIRAALLKRLRACEARSKRVRDTALALRSLCSDPAFEADPEVLMCLVNEASEAWSEIQALRIEIALDAGLSELLEEQVRKLIKRGEETG